MYEALFGILVFCLLAAASLGVLFYHRRLPQRLWQDDTVSTVRLIAGFFTVMTSLVLGLMINSAKNTYEAIDRNVHDYAMQIILLDRALRNYGPETEPAREPLITYVARIVNDTTPDGGDRPISNRLSEHLLVEIGVQLRGLTSPNNDQIALMQDARQHLSRVIELRWTLLEQSEGKIPSPMIVMLVAWLMLIFGSHGFLAPRNGIIVGSFVLSAVLIAGTIYLILDMNVPFRGAIQVSPDPLHRAYQEMKS